MFRVIIIAIFLMTILADVLGQTPKNSPGYIKGVIWDSSQNYQLPSLSVSVFKNDSALVAYTLSNSIGIFEIDNIPLSVELNIYITGVGYRPFSKKFLLDSISPRIDFKDIQLHRTEQNLLEEVVVRSLIPVRMNGDTLEFNSDAFKLADNAVVEDLLKSLPGVTVWGDGLITVNGKKINSVTVDGKPFFGSDPKVAIQNLDKKAVEKIQVYQQDNSFNPYDSLFNLNIKLKGNKKDGVFGKVGAGGGTLERYDNDLSGNIYSNNYQLGLVGILNNVNKKGNDVQSILKNTTYKEGLRSNPDFLPRYNVVGNNKNISVGYIFQYDFLQRLVYKQKDLLNSNFLLSDDYNQTIQNTVRVNTIQDEVTQKMVISRLNETSQSTKDFSADNSKNTLKGKFSSNINFNQQTKRNNSVDSTIVFDDSNFSVSSSLYSLGGQSNTNHLNLKSM
jgi:hypothetical protein